MLTVRSKKFQQFQGYVSYVCYAVRSRSGKISYLNVNDAEVTSCTDNALLQMYVHEIVQIVYERPTYVATEDELIAQQTSYYNLIQKETS